jgi:hypothetical protein
VYCCGSAVLACLHIRVLHRVGDGATRFRGTSPPAVRNVALCARLAHPTRPRTPPHFRRTPCHTTIKNLCNNPGHTHSHSPCHTTSDCSGSLPHLPSEAAPISF